MTMEPVTPRHVHDLFPPLLGALLSLLRGLAPADWERPTIAGHWRVRDIAAHLLDGDLRKVSAYRDGHLPAPAEPITSGAALLRLIDGQNATGVAFASRLSPRVITDLLTVSGAWVSELVATLPPEAPSLFAVSWAGESNSRQWMDTGREYTERWHHQAQIRDAVGAPRLLDPAFFEPLLDFSLRAWPAHYAAVSARDGSRVTLQVTGETQAAWSLVRMGSEWVLHRGADPAPDTLVRIACDDVWRVFYNALSTDAARAAATITGDERLALPLLGVRSVIV